MRRSPLILLAIVLAVLVAGCAPAVVGSRNNPVDLQRDRNVTTTAGATVYARSTFPSGAFGLRAGAFTGAFQVPLGVDGSGARVTSEFELVDVVGPAGWSWRLVDVWSESRGGRPPVLVATLQLDVPADARLGGQQLRGTLVARSTGGREPVALIVQVVPRR
ncbi:MAG: hypothetical protein K0A98_16460 [Trueperaceae bacterium]|nr:hypothetical protein [Trueperaceae bacterium]